MINGIDIRGHSPKPPSRECASAACIALSAFTTVSIISGPRKVASNAQTKGAFKKRAYMLLERQQINVGSTAEKTTDDPQAALRRKTNQAFELW
jgi:hypothetical protein